MYIAVPSPSYYITCTARSHTGSAQAYIQTRGGIFRVSAGALLPCVNCSGSRFHTRHTRREGRRRCSFLQVPVFPSASTDCLEYGLSRMRSADCLLLPFFVLPCLLRKRSMSVRNSAALAVPFSTRLIAQAMLVPGCTRVSNPRCIRRPAWPCWPLVSSLSKAWKHRKRECPLVVRRERADDGVATQWTGLRHDDHRRVTGPLTQ